MAKQITRDLPPTTHFLKQLGLATVSSLGLLGIGLIRGFSSPGVPSMQRISSHLVPDSQAISWISSVPPLGATIGSLVAGPWLQWSGRKKVLQFSGPLFALSWAAIALSDSFGLVVGFRFCTGFFAGIVLPAVQVYVGEASHPEVRGLLTSLPSVVMAGGVLLQYLLGHWLEWRATAWASAVPPLLLTVALIPFPESPAWLKLKGRPSREAYEWYGLPSEPIPSERPLLPTTTRFPILDRSVLVPFSLVLVILIFQQTCGNDVILFNTVLIFRAAGSSIDDSLATILVGVVHVVFIVGAMFLVDRFGRKFLLALSTLGMSVSMAALGTYFHLQRTGQAEGLGFLPLTSLIIYIATFSIGFCTVPLVLVAEIIPLKQRSVLGSVCTSVALISMFIELKTYAGISEALGEEGAFWIYSFFCLVAIFVIVFLLPETKGKTLEEIEMHFQSQTKILKEPKIQL